VWPAPLTRPAAIKGRSLLYPETEGVALSELSKLLSIPAMEFAVIGDSGNDIAMFERSGLSIAMGKASPEVRRAADFGTDSNREEGSPTRSSASSAATTVRGSASTCREHEIAHDRARS
jgi:hypothetical protein